MQNIVNRIRIFKSEWSEFVVRCDGARSSDYETNDIDDAVSTALDIRKRCGNADTYITADAYAVRRIRIARPTLLFQRDRIGAAVSATLNLA